MLNSSTRSARNGWGEDALLLEINFCAACLGIYEVGASNLPYESEAVVQSASSKGLLRNITVL